MVIRVEIVSFVRGIRESSPPRAIFFFGAMSLLVRSRYVDGERSETWEMGGREGGGRGRDE